MEDVKIMRRTNTSAAFRTTYNDTSWTQVVPRNTKRIGLILGVQSGVNAMIATSQLAATDMGLVMGFTPGPIVLSLMQHGSLVFGPFFARNPNVGNAQFVYIESTLDEEEK
jgi:hypothetical protein